MTGLFSRFKSAFAPAEKKQSEAEPADSIIVEQPSTFSMLTAQYGFYTTILGEVDDQKPLSVPQKLVQNVVQKSLSDREKRIKSILFFIATI